MRLVFTKGSGKMDRMTVIHGDGRTEDIDCPKQRIIPHDMVHYAIESELHHRGFLSMVRDGAALAYQSLGGDSEESVERLVEAFQAMMWSGGASDGDIRYAYETACVARGNPAFGLSDDDIAVIRARLAALTEAWDKVAVGGSLTLDF